MPDPGGWPSSRYRPMDSLHRSNVLGNGFLERLRRHGCLPIPLLLFFPLKNSLPFGLQVTARLRQDKPHPGRGQLPGKTPSITVHVSSVAPHGCPIPT